MSCLPEIKDMGRNLTLKSKVMDAKEIWQFGRASRDITSAFPLKEGFNWVEDLYGIFK